jgi:hypothetical protein
LSRKSPGSKPKLPPRPAPRKPTLQEQRINFFLGYITQVNRGTLIALHHLGLAPDCQIAEIPALVDFDHNFEALEFHARGFVTNGQATVLESAANDSIDALLDELVKMSKGLYTAVTAGARDLAAALQPGPVTKRDFRPGEVSLMQRTGCCYYNNGTCASDMPENLCLSDPNAIAWLGGQACPPPPPE